MMPTKVLFRYPKCTPIPTNSGTRLRDMLWTQFGDNFWREARFSLDFKETVSREIVLNIYLIFIPKSLVVAYCSFRTFPPEIRPDVWQLVRWLTSDIGEESFTSIKTPPGLSSQVTTTLSWWDIRFFYCLTSVTDAHLWRCLRWSTPRHGCN